MCTQRRYVHSDEVNHETRADTHSGDNIVIGNNALWRIDGKSRGQRCIASSEWQSLYQRSGAAGYLFGGDDSFPVLILLCAREGLFIVSSSEFDHAVQSGRFENREMKFDVPGIAFKLVAARSILENSRPAWVRYDPGFTLDVKTLMFGYGDSESAPYDWPKQVGKHI